MKKILIATTALVATAGVASADITMSGYGRLGVVVDETAASAAVAAGLTATEVTSLNTTAAKAARAAALSADVEDSNAVVIVKAADGTVAAGVPTVAGIKAIADAIAAEQKELAADTLLNDATAMKGHADSIAALQALQAALQGKSAVAQKSTTKTYSRFLLGFTGSTVADNGMEFGAYMQIRTTNGPNDANGARVHAKMGDVTLYGGNIPGPLESMPNVYTKTVGFSGGTYQGLVTGVDKLAYSQTEAGANGLQLDYSNGDFTIKMAHEPANDVNQAMASYSMNGLTVAVGGQFSKVKAEDSTIVSLGYNFGDVSFGFASSEQDKIRHSSLSAQGSIAPGVTLSGYVTDKEKEKNNGWGLGIAYDLGGGAKFAAGYEGRFDKTNYAEAGFHFNF